jgi:hypothetical protein
LTSIGSTWEGRFGIFDHNVNGVERGTVDLKGELVSPRISTRGNDLCQVAVPRVALGGNANLSGRTSFAYVDLLWTIPLSPGGSPKFRLVRWFTMGRCAAPRQ